MWDWKYILLDGIIGATAAGLGWLFTQRLRQTSARGANLITVGFVVVAVVSSQVITSAIRDRKMRKDLYAAGMTLYGNERAAARHAAAHLPILKHPKLMARLKTTAPVGQGHGTGFAELTGNGMARLPPEDLDATFEIKRALVAVSPDLCAGFWTGTHKPGAVAEGLRKMKDTQQDRWIDVSARAIILELESTTPPPRLAAATVDQALADLVHSLPFEGRAAYAAASGTHPPTPEQACAAFIALADGMKNVAADKRETIIRMTNNPALVDP